MFNSKTFLSRGGTDHPSTKLVLFVSKISTFSRYKKSVASSNLARATTMLYSCVFSVFLLPSFNFTSLENKGNINFP